MCLIVATAILSSSTWAGGKPADKGSPFGQPGDGNPTYKWRAAEDSVDKNSNQVLFSGTNPNNVCNNPISAEPGRNPECGGPTP